MIAVYAIVKFIAYSAWCYLGSRLARSMSANLRSAVALGAIRWLIGLSVGIVIFFLAGSIDSENAARMYFLIYTPVRAIEWAIMVVLIVWRSPRASTPASWFALPVWYIGAIAVSFLTDLLSPEGVQGRFCIGRCLC